MEKKPESRPESPQLAAEDKEPPPFVEKEGVARLKITIVGASGLKKADALGGSDPYVICEVPGKGMVSDFTTRKINSAKQIRGKVDFVYLVSRPKYCRTPFP